MVDEAEEHYHGDEHEKKSVLKKVKAKAKKIKDTIKKHGNDHDHPEGHQHIPDDHDLDEEDEEDEEIVEDPEIHGAPMYESAAIGSSTLPDERPRVVLHSANTESNDQNRGNDFGGEEGYGVQRIVNLEKPTGLIEDPDGPRSTPTTYQNQNIHPSGAGVLPLPSAAEIDIIPVQKSFTTMKLHDDPKPKLSSNLPSQTHNHYPHDQNLPHLPTSTHYPPASIPSHEKQSPHIEYEPMEKDKPSEQSITFTDTISPVSSVIANTDKIRTTHEDHKTKDANTNVSTMLGTSPMEYGKKIAEEQSHYEPMEKPSEKQSTFIDNDKTTLTHQDYKTKDANFDDIFNTNASSLSGTSPMEYGKKIAEEQSHYHYEPMEKPSEKQSTFIDNDKTTLTHQDHKTKDADFDADFSTNVSSMSGTSPMEYGTKIAEEQSHHHYEPMEKPSEKQSTFTENDKTTLTHGGHKTKDADFDANASSMSGTSPTEYSKKIAASLTEKLAPVYERVAGVGNAVKSRVSGTTSGGDDNGVSVKDYLVEKLRPGDEDRALSEVISETLQKHKEEDKTGETEHVKLGKVTESEKVKKRLGESGEEKSEKGGGYEEGYVNSSEKGMVDKVKNVVGSWFGKTEENQSSKDEKSFTNKRYMPLLLINYFCLFVGSVSSSLLSKYYFIHKGSSKWVSTWVQTSGFPLLLIPIYLPHIFKLTKRHPFTNFTPRLLLLSLLVGLMLGLNNFLFSWGNSYLPVSTSALLLSTQLVFTLILSAVIVKQKITFSNLNCVVLLTISSFLLAINSGNEKPQGLTKEKYFIGFFCTIGAGLLFALYLPVMEMVYREVYCYGMVMEMQFVMEFAATVFAVVGMAAGGGFSDMREESGRVFDRGAAVYWAAVTANVVTWQLCFMGTAGMVFLTSSITGGISMTALLSMNVVGGVVTFRDRFDGIKAMSTVLCLWGFCSYVYGMYMKKKKEEEEEKGKKGGSVGLFNMIHMADRIGVRSN
ncbi:putative purine permease 4 [Senna tora]|uniref:Putative purine permease 4 n=1 Tax=Senna tora TaxID=362788 RepID=A0A834W8P0_9FABA|nr:putative purine permease 4 [Senna tora]